MRCLNLRILLASAALLGTAGCATTEEWTEWNTHQAHFASANHLRFSVKNRFAPPLIQEPRDIALAGEESWWGGPFDDRPLVNVAGRWSGTWSGVGAYRWPFSSHAEAEFAQDGRFGKGRMVLEDTLTMDVPEILTVQGMQGVRVMLEVSGSTLVVRHEAGGRWLTGEFTVDGDRMTGRLKDSTARLVLVRQK
jgi:hypothetical protein